MRISPLFLILCILNSSCSGTLPDYATLGALRILSLKADVPEKDDTTNTSSINITPIISDLNGNGRTLTYVATLCQDPGIALGVTPTCATTTSNYLAISSGAVTVTGPSGTTTGTGPTVTIPQASIPINITVGLPIFNQFNGMALIVNYVLTASDGTQVNSIKRIISSASVKPVKNTNPSITAVNTISQSGNVLTMNVSTAAQTNTYLAMSTDGSVGTQTKTWVNTWFISDGKMAYDRTIGTDANTWTQPANRPAGRAEVIVVITRDGLGGEDYKVLTF
jgi:hypothetical protein